MYEYDWTAHVNKSRKAVKICLKFAIAYVPHEET